MRLADHLHHYNLVHLLHLPYLLNSQTDDRDLTYSKVTCVNASREILIRVIAFRTFKRNMMATYCRTADFFALMAGMTILLAHIDGHKLQEDDWRAHQRLGDRALVGQLLQSYDNVHDYMDDDLTKQSAVQLRRLMNIESEAARGKGDWARDTVSNIEKDCGELQLNIPYFGIINIGRMGVTKSRKPDPSASHNDTEELSRSAATIDGVDPADGGGIADRHTRRASGDVGARARGDAARLQRQPARDPRRHAREPGVDVAVADPVVPADAPLVPVRQLAGDARRARHRIDAGRDRRIGEHVAAGEVRVDQLPDLDIGSDRDVAILRAGGPRGGHRRQSGQRAKGDVGRSGTDHLSASCP